MVGPHRIRVTVSGDDDPAEVLIGQEMRRLISAIPIVQAAAGGAPVVVVGGLAVMCRLGRAHRATSDLDTLSRRNATEQQRLEVLA